MKSNIFRILFFALAIFYCLNLYAQTVSTQLDNLFTSPQYPLNGNTLVAKNGKVIYQKSFGFADEKNNILNNENSKFQLASITKIFTSTAILQLKDKGKLNLDDSLAEYFPDFLYPEITIRHLLTHTSGLPDFQMFEELVANNREKVFTNSDIIPALKNLNKPLLFKAGESWSYSNSGYCLLALLIEKLSGMKFEDYIRQQIFIQAKMNDSYFETDPPKTSDANNTKTQVYPTLYAKELQTVNMPRWRGFTGNGGIITTTGDMLKFDQALYSGKLLKHQSLDEAFRPMKLNDGKNAKTDSLNSFYGLGWFIFEDESIGKIVWHGGGRLGIVTAFLRNITKKQTVVVFDNSFNRQTYRIGLGAMNILNNKSFNFPKKSLVRDFGLTLVEQGIDEAFCKLIELKSDSANYYIDEAEMAELAFQLIDDVTLANHQQLALESAKLLTVYFPESSNAYEAYGEILSKTGKKDAAISIYKKAIVLNPKNEDAKKSLNDLLNKK